MDSNHREAAPRKLRRTEKLEGQRMNASGQQRFKGELVLPPGLISDVGLEARNTQTAQRAQFHLLVL